MKYLCIADWDKNDVFLQKGETIDYKWVDKNVLLEMGEYDLASIRTLEIVRKS